MSHHQIATSGRYTTLLSAQTLALQLALSGAPLSWSLDRLLIAAEAQAGHRFRASMLLLDEDGVRLGYGAAPSLPAEFLEGIRGTEVSPHGSPCGRAAHFGQPIELADIERGNSGARFRQVALSHGLRACWSSPIVAAGGGVLGTLALYYQEPIGPSEEDREIAHLLGRTAALIIGSARSDEEGCTSGGDDCSAYVRWALGPAEYASARATASFA